MRITFTFLTILLVLAVASVTGQETEPNTYFSSNGKFVISLPDGWAQVDYNTVDYFLINSNASQQALNYEAVFALKDTIPFHEGPYFILTVDTSGILNQAQVDSLLEQLSETFGVGIKYFPTGDYLADLESQAPNWDAQKRQISIRTNITEQYKIVKRNLWVMQLYDGGIANFYFFTPDSLFTQYSSTFEQIVNSFSVENMEASIPKQQHKLADLKDDPDGGIGSDKLKFVGLPIGVVVVLIIIIGKRRRDKRKQQES